VMFNARNVERLQSKYARCAHARARASTLYLTTSPEYSSMEPGVP
jgi:elongation factor P--beta-lysine ligase